MPTEDPQEHAHDDILPEIVVDESAEQYVQQPEEEEDQPPLPAPAEAEEPVQNEVVVEPELPPAPEQDNIFQTGKPVKKKRNVSEKQRAHLERIRTKALERKKEKAAERKAARATSHRFLPSDWVTHARRRMRTRETYAATHEPNEHRKLLRT